MNTRLPSHPIISREHCARHAVRNCGRVGSFHHNVHRTGAYDFARDARTSKAPLPTARSCVAAAPGAFATVKAYDPQADAWSVLPPLPAPRHGAGAAVVDEIMLIPGGGPRPGGNQSDTLFALSS